MTTSEEYLEQLAAEWKQTAEEYRADLQVERDRSRTQAAVIERVRAAVAPFALDSAYALSLVRNALAAAPEHTEQDPIASMWHKLHDKEQELDVANARVAELEDVAATEARARLRLMNDLDTANARASAAELKARLNDKLSNAAEDEAAALRTRVAELEEQVRYATERLAAAANAREQKK